MRTRPMQDRNRDPCPLSIPWIAQYALLPSLKASLHRASRLNCVASQGQGGHSSTRYARRHHNQQNTPALVNVRRMQWFFRFRYVAIMEVGPTAAEARCINIPPGIQFTAPEAAASRRREKSSRGVWRMRGSCLRILSLAPSAVQSTATAKKDRASCRHLSRPSRPTSLSLDLTRRCAESAASGQTHSTRTSRSRQRSSSTTAVLLAARIASHLLSNLLPDTRGSAAPVLRAIYHLALSTRRRRPCLKTAVIGQ
ncbi:uncharacterized protein IWZ02DRAFT_156633 [Phyllosticta citriasiana]|uniref:uncharacterized protein n=1 Tax=Phyllosticta citriasiana TaxID=595635 RepID=UPI0030FD4930